MSSKANCLTILSRSPRSNSCRLADISSILSAEWLIFMSWTLSTETWSPRTFSSIGKILWRLLTSDWVTLTNRGKCWKRLAGRLVMQHHRWSRAKSIMVLKWTFGVVELFFSQWYVGTYPLRTVILHSCIRRFYLGSTYCPTSCQTRSKTCLRRYWM